MFLSELLHVLSGLLILIIAFSHVHYVIHSPSSVEQMLFECLKVSGSVVGSGDKRLTKSR